MLHFCSCFNSMFSSNACDNISVKQPEACSLAFTSLSLPRLRRAQLKWKVSGAGFCDPWATPCGFPQRWETCSAILPRPLTELGPLAKICQSARDVPTLHWQQREEFWADPTPALDESSKRPPLLCSSARMQTDTAWSVLEHARKLLLRNGGHVS